MAIPGLFFLYFFLFDTDSIQLIVNIFGWWWDLNFGSLVLQLTTLPTEPQPPPPPSDEIIVASDINTQEGMLPFSLCQKLLWKMENGCSSFSSTMITIAPPRDMQRNRNISVTRLGDFLTFLATTFLEKVAQNLVTFGAILKNNHVMDKFLCLLFLGKFSKH